MGMCIVQSHPCLFVLGMLISQCLNSGERQLSTVCLPHFLAFPCAALLPPLFVWGARRAWEQGYSSNWYNCERVMHTFLLTTGVEATWLQDVVVVLHQFDTNTSHSNHHTYNAHTHTQPHYPVLSQHCYSDWPLSLICMYCGIILSDNTRVQNNSLPYWCMLLRKPSFVKHCF